MPRSAEISALAAGAPSFRTILEDARRNTKSEWIEWYPYDSLSNLVHLDRLLTGAHRDLAGLAGDHRILDIGCADGELALYFDSLGFEVTCLDHPRTNQNGMRGVRALKQQLNAGIDIREIDLDAGFTLGEDQYGLALLLGTIYHLKNPIYVLETLSKHARHCVLSTRIARYLPGRDYDVSRLPVAYLLDETELNADNSNFWIFSDCGLRRVLSRSNWRILDYLTVGDDSSDPVARDQRAFCLVRSTYAMADVRLVKGFHEPEDSGWRWVEKEFEAVVTPARPGAMTVRLRIFVPVELIGRFGPVTIAARIDAFPLEPQTYSAPGEYVYERSIRQPTQSDVNVTFTVDKAFSADASDSRERAIIVAGLTVE